MAEGLVGIADGIVRLVATEDITRDSLNIDFIILTGTAAGSFVFTLGNFAVTVTTGANDLTKVIPVNRKVHYAKLTSGPTAAHMYIFLKKG